MSAFLTTNQDTKSRAGGFALLYTILIISIATGLSGIILSSQTRQTKLTTTANESTRAFYSADVGYECTLYQDRVKDVFDGDSDENINCAGGQVTYFRGPDESGDDAPNDAGRDGERYRFVVENQRCVNVTVDKYEATASDPEKTVIISSGFDDCDNRQVERVLSTSY
jgi:hypothetical protein